MDLGLKIQVLSTALFLAYYDISEWIINKQMTKLIIPED